MNCNIISAYIVLLTLLLITTSASTQLAADTQSITRQIGTGDGSTVQWGPGFLFKTMTPAIQVAPTSLVRGTVVFKAGTTAVRDANSPGVFSGDGKGALNYTNGLFYVTFSSPPAKGTPVTVTFSYIGAAQPQPTPTPTPVPTPTPTPEPIPTPTPTPTPSPTPTPTPTPEPTPNPTPPASPPPPTVTIPPKVITPRDISSLLTPIIQQFNIPGMGAVVVHNNQIIMQGVAGFRDGSVPMTIQDKFHIGSDTKSMTATLIATLVRDGYINWDTLLKDIFPELVSTGKMNPAFYGLSVRQLLIHRGGMPTDATYNTFKNAAPNDVVQQRQLMMENVLSQPPAVALGVYQYSNVGYIIAGHIAEKYLGKSWEDLMKERVFAPLGITSAGYGSPETPGQVDQPIGHSSDGVRKPGVDNPPIMGPASRVNITLQDWAAYANSHLQGARGEEQLTTWYSDKGIPVFLAKSLFDMMQDPGAGNFAMGWGLSGSGATKILIHTGSNTLWYALIWLDAGQDTAILVGVNQGGTNAYNAMMKAREVLAGQPLD